MKKTRELIRDNLKMVDAVIEVVDARIPVSSRNPLIDEILGSKPRIIALNKSDLADGAASKGWAAAFEAAGYRSVILNANSGSGIADLAPLLQSPRFGQQIQRYRLALLKLLPQRVANHFALLHGIDPRAALGDDHGSGQPDSEEGRG